LIHSTDVDGGIDANVNVGGMYDVHVCACACI